jgi:hypothetical protein
VVVVVVGSVLVVDVAVLVVLDVVDAVAVVAVVVVVVIAEVLAAPAPLEVVELPLELPVPVLSLLLVASPVEVLALVTLALLALPLVDGADGEAVVKLVADGTVDDGPGNAVVVADPDTDDSVVSTPVSTEPSLLLLAWAPGTLIPGTTRAPVPSCSHSQRSAQRTPAAAPGDAGGV